MKIKTFGPISVAILLSACSGNSLVAPDTTTTTTTTTTTDSGTPISSSRVLPPGTASPSRSVGIFRREAENTATGSGYVSTISYDSVADTFSVDNLGFDGANSYGRGDVTKVASLGPYAVYEGPSIEPDSVTGTPITQFLHRAIYAVGPDGRTEFAIVRTGSYVGYGFGGFIYQRNDNVTLQTTGQATYSGKYAALRDFKSRPGLEYATGDMRMDIDFSDFNSGSAVKGYINNRAVFDIDGNDITNDVLAALNGTTGTETQLPTLSLTVGPGVMDANGEITGTVNRFTEGTSGSSTDSLDSGKYYAIISGAGADQQVVGVIVTEAPDYRMTDVTVRETGGFILTRQ